MKHANLGGGGIPHRKILKIKPSEIEFQSDFNSYHSIWLDCCVVTALLEFNVRVTVLLEYIDLL